MVGGDSRHLILVLKLQLPIVLGLSCGGRGDSRRLILELKLQFPKIVGWSCGCRGDSRHFMWLSGEGYLEFKTPQRHAASMIVFSHILMQTQNLFPRMRPRACPHPGIIIGNQFKTRSVHADQCIARAWDIVDAAKQDGMISEEQGDLLVGKLMTRIVLVLIDKQNMGPESKRKFKDSNAVKDEFIMEFVKETGAPDSGVDLKSALGDWMPPATNITKHLTTSAADSRGSGSKRIVSVFSAAEQNDPMTIFKENGFNIGDRVRERGIDAKDISTYTIIASGDQVTLQIYDVFGEKDLKVMVPLAKFLDSWSVYKGNVPQMLPDQQMAMRHKNSQFDILRCMAFRAIADHGKSKRELEREDTGVHDVPAWHCRQDRHWQRCIEVSTHDDTHLHQFRSKEPVGCDHAQTHGQTHRRRARLCHRRHGQAPQKQTRQSCPSIRIQRSGGSRARTTRIWST